MYAATKVHNARDYITAGRSLPIYIVLAMVFATWFGAEPCWHPGHLHGRGLGRADLRSIRCVAMPDPVRAVFARKLYRMNLLTIGDFYRQRYGHKVEVIAGIAIALSYLGWVSAQITALG